MPSFEFGLGEIRLETAAGWRSWLEKNHERCEGVWLIYYHKAHRAELVAADLMADAGLRAVDAESAAMRFGGVRQETGWVWASLVARMLGGGLARSGCG